MLMALGLFTFELATVPFESLRRSTAQRWETKPRVGQGPAAQWCGPGEDAITLDAVLMPELTGGIEQLDTLRDMADTGKAWILVAGTGEVLDKWYIASVEQTNTRMLDDGQPRRIACSISLKRYWGNDPAQLGDLRMSTGNSGVRTTGSAGTGHMA